MYLNHEEDGIALVMQTQEEIDFITAILGGLSIWKSPIDIDVQNVLDVYGELANYYTTINDDHIPVFKQVPEFVSKKEWEEGV